MSPLIGFTVHSHCPARPRGSAGSYLSPLPSARQRNGSTSLSCRCTGRLRLNSSVRDDVASHPAAQSGAKRGFQILFPTSHLSCICHFLIIVFKLEVICITGNDSRMTGLAVLYPRIGSGAARLLEALNWAGPAFCLRWRRG